MCELYDDMGLSYTIQIYSNNTKQENNMIINSSTYLCYNYSIQ